MPLKIKYDDLILNKNVDYFHNPFGGIDDEDLLEVIDPKYDLEKCIQLLTMEKPFIIQFVGKKGRGKTTHLRALHQLISNSEIFFLDSRNHQSISNTKERITFIDSIHHIPWKKRLQLWKQSEISYVITTHWFRNIEFIICNRKHKTFRFKGVSTEKLERILKKRISQYSSLQQNEIIINPKVLKILSEHFKDNIRSLLNYLYDCFKVKFYGY
ncbi:hypothetical protein [Aquimarina rubra]|uniref:ATPase AAA-type core domain-containing protein n=1 Tax=Aquimarina rubra TaxID=1920033 RepID=A0ABW5LGT2_9FLAO